MAPTPPARLRLTIGAKLGAVFALLALLQAVLGTFVAVQVASMTLNIDRVLEEQREAAHTRDAVRALQAFEDHLGLLHADERPAGIELDLLVELLDEAQQALRQLTHEPGSADPSEESHQELEEELFASVEADFAVLRAALDERHAGAELTRLLERPAHRARVLHVETRAEAAESSRDLQNRAREMRAAVVGSSAVVLLVLGFAFWTVCRSIVRPVRELEAGARRLGSGELGLRLPVRSDDEIGDLTRELNHMAGELAGMRAGLEERVRARTREFLRAARLAGLGTLAAGIAHEINNPLASIASCAEGLEGRLKAGSLEPAEHEEYLQTIAREAYRAHGITSRLLEFARDDPGEKTACDVAAVAREVELILRHRVLRAGLRLELECPGRPAPVLGNESELKQVLLNLLTNAIDASRPGGRLRLACRGEPHEVCLEVTDQGSGIAAEDLERIFDPFFTTKAPGKGTGLGLAIVHRIVEDHRGRVEVESSPAGTCFRVRLPAAEELAA